MNDRTLKHFKVIEWQPSIVYCDGCCICGDEDDSDDDEMMLFYVNFSVVISIEYNLRHRIANKPIRPTIQLYAE